jgi:hypothetical protein
MFYRRDITVIAYMRLQIFALVGLLLATSCKSQTNSTQSNLDSKETHTNAVLKSQEAVAREIVLVEHDFGDAIFQLNNTNTVGFVSTMEPLTDRLEKISKELDMLGPFPTGLREATLKKLDSAEKNMPHLGTLQPEAAKIAPVMEKYVSAWSSVMDKAGLLVGAKGESSSINTNRQGANIRQ